MNAPKFDNFTSEEVEKYSEQMAHDTKAAVGKSKPVDIPVEKILARMGMISMLMPPTRTSVIAVVGFSAIHAPIVGVKKEDLHKMIDDLYDAVEKNPLTPEAANKYAQMNMEAHLKAELEKTESGTQQVVLPGNVKVH